MAQIKTNLQYGTTGTVQTANIHADAINDTKIADDIIGTEHFTAGEVDQTAIANQAINEAKIQISNAPTNGYFLSAQSGNTGGLTWAEAGGGGKIGQVLQSVQLATQTFSGIGTNWNDCTNLTVNITPSASNSKVLISCDVSTGSSNGGWNYKTRLMRGSTQIYLASSLGSRPSVFGHVDAQRTGTQYNMWKMSATFLDSPSSSSQQTYKIQLQQNSTSATSYVNRTHDDGSPDQSRGVSSITVMEVLA